MYYSFDENENSSDQTYYNSYPGTEQTDRVNGEYHYKNGYTQRIYTDAHYVPQSETTVPPRYYTPPEKNERPVSEVKPKAKGSSGMTMKLICLCLICALLGGFVGASAVGGRLSGRIDALDTSMREHVVESEKNFLGVKCATPTEVSGGPALSGSAVYELACKQTVGISAEITYTNFFGMSSPAAVSGSGFIISDNGYIITNYHVVEEANKNKAEILVMLHDGSSHSAKLVGFAEDNDIAVLKIDLEGLTPVVFGDSDALNVGDAVFAVGNPLGELEFSMSSGHVSAKDRMLLTDESSFSINMLQIDAAVNSGNSGGPLYNDRGEVVGVVTAKYSKTGVEGLGFAIPINKAQSIANDLITKGYVTGIAYMGIEMDTRYTAMYSQYYGWPLGAYVKIVNSGSCAEKAGLQPGDIITRLGDDIIESSTDLSNAVRSHSAGETVEIEVYRADESRTVIITFDERVPN